MKGKRIIGMAILVTLVATILGLHAASTRAALPGLPHAFYGTLTVDGKPAPVGTRVEARGEGVKVDIIGNPIVTTEAGWYGSSEAFGSKLVVQGEITEGTIISFYVNGDFTRQTWPWHSGDITRLDLEVGTLTISAPETGQTKPTESELSANWTLVGGIVAGYTLVFWVLFIFIRRRRAC